MGQRGDLAGRRGCRDSAQNRGIDNLGDVLRSANPGVQDGSDEEVDETDEDADEHTDDDALGDGAFTSPHRGGDDGRLGDGQHRLVVAGMRHLGDSLLEVRDHGVDDPLGVVLIVAGVDDLQEHRGRGHLDRLFQRL